MIDARMFLINRRFVVLRGVGVIFARRSFDADMVLDIGIEAAAQRVFLRIFPRPRPHRDARRCRLVGLVVADRFHPLGKALRQEGNRSEEHTSELQSLMRISYAVFCLKKKKNKTKSKL